MSLAEIEAAIERLSGAELEQLAQWLDAFRIHRTAPLPVETWLDRARGAANGGRTTAEVMALTRGDE